ncbi:hypothetical protein UA75_21500 [Actinoalloteichus sp. GBA129-24]|uniref:Uncharacterized protein n=1 Tax=Actinoalloteichus fjordicus TaxID=1612552 RepID=A0AAC9LH51_9PSEU|nr:hypothetical protein UA74_21020 [Actinoalloteichus fjordicus]APU22289.1 hypothetical protein UA75_21500 [Actinoalloteichus sp. GBA129-24]
MSRPGTDDHSAVVAENVSGCGRLPRLRSGRRRCSRWWLRVRGRWDRVDPSTSALVRGGGGTGEHSPATPPRGSPVTANGIAGSISVARRDAGSTIFAGKGSPAVRRRYWSAARSPPGPDGARSREPPDGCPRPRRGSAAVRPGRESPPPVSPGCRGPLGLWRRTDDTGTAADVPGGGDRRREAARDHRDGVAVVVAGAPVWSRRGLRRRVRPSRRRGDRPPHRQGR